MKTATILLLVLTCAPLAAQDFHSAFKHDGVNGTKALGHDTDGNLYVAAGGTGPGGANQTFYPGPLNTQATDIPEWGFIVTKHAPDNTLLWWRGFSMDPAATAPGNLELLVYDMAVADNGDLFIVGTFAGTVDFDPGAGQANLTATTTLSAVSYNGFLVKLNADGDFQWARHWQGRTEAISVAVASGGNVHVSGTGEGGEMDLDPGTAQEIVKDLVGNYPYAAAWISTLDSAGNYLWGHFMTVDTTVTQQSSSIETAVLLGSAVDSAGNLIVGGVFGGSYAPASANPSQYDPNELVILTEGSPEPRFTGTGNKNALIISYDPNGNRRWLRHYSSPLSVAMSGTSGWDVAVDDEDSVYFTGGFRGEVSFDPPSSATLLSEYNTTEARYENSPFIQKLDSSGNHQWVHGFNGLGAHNSGKRVIADSTGVVVGGIFATSIDLDPGAGSAIHDPANGQSFLAKYNKQGTYQWSSNFGSTAASGQSHPGSDVRGLSMTGAHRVVAGGHFNGDFHDVSPGTQTLMTPYSGQATSWILVMDQTSLHAALQIDQTSVPTLTTGQSVDFEFTASGGSEVGYGWTITQGSLPPGITLSGTTGASIRAVGTVMQDGAWDFELQVEDDRGNVALRAFTWTVDVAPLQTGNGTGGTGGGGGGCVAGHGSTPMWVAILAVLAASVLLRRRVAYSKD